MQRNAGGVLQAVTVLDILGALVSLDASACPLPLEPAFGTAEWPWIASYGRFTPDMSMRNRG